MLTRFAITRADLPSGKAIAARYGRLERWGKLVKTAKVRTRATITGLIRFIVSKNAGYHFTIVLPAQGPFLPCTSRIL